jgi:multidrug resistance efflux pump
MSSSAPSAGPTASVASISGEERQAFAKLEALKEIRSKTIGLEKLRLRLLHDVDSIEGEDKCLSEYRREMELLQQEKMAHVEELRQIHADINAMETVMKQAEEAKRQAVDSARRIIDDYAPLKHDVSRIFYLLKKSFLN